MSRARVQRTSRGGWSAWRQPFLRQNKWARTSRRSHHHGLNGQHQRSDETGGRRGRNRRCGIRRSDREACCNQPQQADSRNRGRNLLYSSADPDAEPLYAGEGENEAGSNQRAVVLDPGNHAAQELHRGHDRVGRRGHVRQAVGPADRESGGIAHGFARINVKPPARGIMLLSSATFSAPRAAYTAPPNQTSIIIPGPANMTPRDRVAAGCPLQACIQLSPRCQRRGPARAAESLPGLCLCWRF